MLWTLSLHASPSPRASLLRWRYDAQVISLTPGADHAVLQVHADKMRAALTMDVLATDLADYLVRKGVSGPNPDIRPRVSAAHPRACDVNLSGTHRTHSRFLSGRRITSQDERSRSRRRGSAS